MPTVLRRLNLLFESVDEDQCIRGRTVLVRDGVLLDCCPIAKAALIRGYAIGRGCSLETVALWLARRYKVKAARLLILAECWGKGGSLEEAQRIAALYPV